MGKSIDRIKRPLGRVVLAFWLSSSTTAYALGFGEIRLESALGQALDARIPVMSVSPDERRSLTVRMAGPKAFERFGIERTAAIDMLTLKVDDTGDPGGRIALHLTSARPIQEPFLNFLIVAETDGGRVLREYTVLLDPPGWTARPAPPVAAPRARSVEPARVVSVVERPAVPARKTAVPAVIAAGEGRNGQIDRALGAASFDVARPRRYGPVGPGETLWSIASRMQFPGVSTQQMLLAIYRTNPSAFDGSVNLLLQGSMLAIPPADRVRAIDSTTARRLVAAAREKFSATIRENPAAPVAPSQASPVPSNPAASTPSRPPPLPKPEIAPVAVGRRLRLEVPRQFPGIDGASAVPPVSPSTRPPERLVGPEFGTLSPAPVVLQAAAEPTRAVAADTGRAMGGFGFGEAAAAEVDTTARSGNRPLETLPKATSRDVGATTDDDAMLDAAAAADDGVAEPWRAPGSERDVAASLQAGLFSPSNILLLLAAAGLLVALLLWQRRRQYKPVPADFSAGFATAGNDADAFDSAAADLPDTAGPPAEYAGGPTGPGVSPELQLQDAENQIAIGLFDQARATIEEGLACYPGHAELQDKLLELDYVNGDADRFRADIERFRSALVRNGVRWAGISAMGRILAPEDPRFAFGKSKGETSAEDTPVSPSGPAPQLSSGEPDAQETERPAARQPVESDSADAAPEEDGPPARAPETPAFDIDDAQAFIDPAVDASESDAGASSSSGLDLDVENTNLNDWPSASADDIYAAPQAGHTGSHVEGCDSFDPGAAPAPAETGTDDRFSSRVEQHSAGDDTLSFDIDLSEFDLDREAAAEDSASEDDADPVETRLDVARMYIEMQDPGSARGLLYEVVEDGNPEQRNIAQALLDRL